jgi:hypothetical protein
MGEPEQAPALHVSVLVQALWSLHALPLGADDEGRHAPSELHAPTEHSGMPSEQAEPIGAGIAPQMPLEGSHTPTWHPTSNAEQSLGLPPPHCPALHVLFVLQGSPESTHGALSLLGSGFPTHFPVAGSQATLLHSFNGENEQSLGSPMQSPMWHTPLDWQRSVGVHAAPSFTGVTLQDFDSS